MKKFKELGLSDPILKTIHENGFEEPTEIQKKSIPVVLNEQDVIAGSKTGSGKTLVFSSAVIQATERDKYETAKTIVKVNKEV